ncbi:10500_t:CDS:1 [Ambispora leptoticha]|uniref:10500_t:CDS:1 n=1 Tax=Ambispora leptoticha TaxID=144679 RepID=A0A9N9F207_9GLOM|nr:10500_t:CDS:1 [Ambispora leptoticha]
MSSRTKSKPTPERRLTSPAVTSLSSSTIAVGAEEISTSQEPDHNILTSSSSSPAVVNAEITRLHKELVAATKSNKIHSSKISRLESEAKTLRASITKLTSEKKEIQSKKDEKSNVLLQENNSLKSKFSAAQKELVRLRRRNEELESATGGIIKGGKSETQTTDVESLRNELKQVQNANKNLKTEMKKLSTDYEQAKQQTDEYKRQVMKMEKECNVLKENNKKLTAEKNRIEREHKDSRQQIDHLTSRNQHLVQKSISLGAEKNKLKSDLYSQQDEYVQLRQTNRKLASEKNSLKRRSGTFNIRIDPTAPLTKDSVIKSDNSSSRTISEIEDTTTVIELENARNEIDELRNQISIIQNDGKTLTEANQQLTKDKNQLEITIKECQERIEQLVSHNKQLIDELENLKATNQQSEINRSSREVELSAKMQELTTLNSQMQEEISNLRQDYESVKDNNTLLISKNEHWENTVTELRERIEQLTSRNQQLREESNKLTTQYGERVNYSNTREKQLNSRIMELEQLNKQLLDQINLSNRERDSFKQNYSQFEREIHDCRELIDRLSSQNQHLMDECNSKYTTPPGSDSSRNASNAIVQMSGDLSLKVTELQQQNEELSKKLTDMKRERDDAKGKLIVCTAKMQAQIKELKKEASQYRFTLASRTDLTAV